MGSLEDGFCLPPNPRQKRELETMRMERRVKVGSSSPCSAWVESSRGQVLAFRREDNGDRSEWSAYNRGRADALEAAIEDVQRLLSTVPVSDGTSKI